METVKTAGEERKLIKAKDIGKDLNGEQGSAKNKKGNR